MTEPMARRGLTGLAKEVAELRATFQQLPRQLVANYQFEGLWGRFVERLRPLMALMNGEPWDPADGRIAAEVAGVDDLRIELLSLKSVALPTTRDPLNLILHTSLRTPSATLYQLFGQLRTVPEEGTIQLQVVSLARFDAQAAECKGLIAWARQDVDDALERQGARLTNLERALAEERAHTLATVEAARGLQEPTLRGVLEKWSQRGNVVARAALWLFGHKLQATLAALALAAFTAILRWLRL